LRAQTVVNLDGKALRGTIPAGQTSGVHLLAAYAPTLGATLAQMAVAHKTNEIGAAPGLLRTLDLAGVVVTGDAMYAQRALSTQIVEAGGDYCWVVKDNQATLLADLELLFSDIEIPVGCGAVPLDFATDTSVEKAHGRLEERIVTTSSLLAGYVDWPSLAQAIKVERSRTSKAKQTHEVAYAITSLPSVTADAARMGEIIRAHWGIENGLHYRRDVTLREDGSLVRMGCAPQVLAALNNLVCGLAAQAGITNLAALQRAFAHRFDQLLNGR
jgi:predicted transposase YbfD/YdcC